MLFCDRLCFFFFQAEDGIRDWSVTGVQTCALPILIVALWSYLPIAIAPFLPKPTDGSTAASAGIFAQLIVLTYYIPALLLVLRRPNDGPDDSLVQPQSERTITKAVQ